MTTLLAIDLETTAIKPEDGFITEVGVVLWDVEAKAPVQMYSALVKPPSGQLIPAEITALTGITNKMLTADGRSPDDVYTDLEGMLTLCHWVVAHNADFEKGWLAAAEVEYCVPFIDTMLDIPYRPSKGKGSLSEICMAHGVFNPMPHRALFDAFAMLQVLAQYDFDEVLQRAKSPTITLGIKFPFDVTGERNQAVKALGGWRWEGELRIWRKRLKEIDLSLELAKAHLAGFEPFPVLAEEEIPA